MPLPLSGRNKTCAGVERFDRGLCTRKGYSISTITPSSIHFSHKVKHIRTIYSLHVLYKQSHLLMKVMHPM